MVDVFCSYVGEEVELVADFVAFLETEGFECWHFKRDSLPGLSYLSQTGGQIHDCGCFMIFVSKRSVASHQMTKELIRAHEEGKPCIPILVDVDHAYLQEHQPEWREAIGASVSISLLERSVEEVKQAVAKGLAAMDMKTSGRPMPWSAINQRFLRHASPEHGLRLIRTPTSGLPPALGPASRPYVMIGDYAELRGRTLKAILEALYIGVHFDEVNAARSSWLAVKVAFGMVNTRAYDLLPATWKAIYRVCSDPKRLGLWQASGEERAEIESGDRDYWTGSQGEWHGRLTRQLDRLIDLGHPEVAAVAHALQRRVTPEALLVAWFGVHGCFSGDGRGRQGVRILLQRNLPLAEMECEFIPMGDVQGGLVLP
jgi:hypothetical protein